MVALKDARISREEKPQAEQLAEGRLRCACQLTVPADKSNVGAERRGDTLDKSPHIGQFKTNRFQIVFKLQKGARQSRKAVALPPPLTDAGVGLDSCTSAGGVGPLLWVSGFARDVLGNTLQDLHNCQRRQGD